MCLQQGTGRPDADAATQWSGDVWAGCGVALRSCSARLRSWRARTWAPPGARPGAHAGVLPTLLPALLWLLPGLQPNLTMCCACPSAATHAAPWARSHRRACREHRSSAGGAVGVWPRLCGAAGPTLPLSEEQMPALQDACGTQLLPPWDGSAGSAGRQLDGSPATASPEQERDALRPRRVGHLGDALLQLPAIPGVAVVNGDGILGVTRRRGVRQQPHRACRRGRRPGRRLLAAAVRQAFSPRGTAELHPVIMGTHSPGMRCPPASCLAEQILRRLRCAREGELPAPAPAPHLRCPPGVAPLPPSCCRSWCAATSSAQCPGPPRPCVPGSCCVWVWGCWGCLFFFFWGGGGGGGGGGAGHPLAGACAGREQAGGGKATQALQHVPGASPTRVGHRKMHASMQCLREPVFLGLLARMHHSALHARWAARSGRAGTGCRCLERPAHNQDSPTSSVLRPAQINV